jgi:hypothetical protein
MIKIPGMELGHDSAVMRTAGFYWCGHCGGLLKHYYKNARDDRDLVCPDCDPKTIRSGPEWAHEASMLMFLAARAWRIRVRYLRPLTVLFLVSFGIGLVIPIGIRSQLRSALAEHIDVLLFALIWTFWTPALELLFRDSRYQPLYLSMSTGLWFLGSGERYEWHDELEDGYREV